MSTNDPKSGEARDHAHESRPEHRTDPSRKGQGPNNPLPGEPGGPTTGGFTAEERKAAEEGQRRETRDDKDHAKDNPGNSKR